MKTQLLHTPEGVRDIYNGECRKKHLLQDRLKQAIEAYGYRMIQTPAFEFFDTFGKEIGTIPSKNLYKFFDREGNTLVLRPDITPSVARAAAMYFGAEDLPIRLSYMGNTFINNSSYQGRLKENTQLGAELIGDNSVDADAEMIAMAAECLRLAGLKEFQISIGHSDFFQGLMEAAGLTEDAQEELRELIANKNFFGVEEALFQFDIHAPLRELFGMLGSLAFSAGELERARALAADYPKILSAVDRLIALHEALEIYGADKHISYDLGMVSGYRYYTGIIFMGYTYGSGEPVLKGGRYDRLLCHFGKDAPAVGFAIVIDTLMAVLSRNRLEIALPARGEVIVYEKGCLRQAVSMAENIRKNGGSAELICADDAHAKADYEAYAKRAGRTGAIFLSREENQA